jgi:hypothetical protein
MKTRARSAVAVAISVSGWPIEPLLPGVGIIEARQVPARRSVIRDGAAPAIRGQDHNTNPASHATIMDSIGIAARPSTAAPATGLHATTLRQTRHPGISARRVPQRRAPTQDESARTERGDLRDLRVEQQAGPENQRPHRRWQHHAAAPDGRQPVPAELPLPAFGRAHEREPKGFEQGAFAISLEFPTQPLMDLLPGR